MSPTTPFQDRHANAKTNNALCPPLKINKDFHMIKKSSSASLPSSSSSSSASLLGIAGSTKPRHPVIIYTHSPKVIHTHPRDFMALVQKLTGLSDDHHNNKPRVKQEVKGNNNNNNTSSSSSSREDDGIIKNVKMDDSESSSVITDENCGGSMGDRGQINSCFMPPICDPPNPYITNIPVFTPNSTDFLCANPAFYNYTDSLFFNTSSILSSPNMEGMNEY